MNDQKTPPTADDLCTLDEAAEILNVSRRSIRRYVAAGRIGTYKPEFGRPRLLRADVVQAALASIVPVRAAV